jgi:hypothetical protein
LNLFGGANISGQTPEITMTEHKDDFQISLFGLPKCHFQFSRDDIARMEGFKYNFERLIETDFIKREMYTTPIVYAGKVEQVIPEALWSDFNEKFRHFVLQKDKYNYLRVRRIVFQHPRGRPTDGVRLQMVRMIDHQKKIADDAYENHGMFNFQTASGEVISTFELWKWYVYTYHFHVDLTDDNVNLPRLKAFGMTPDNPNARAQLVSCLLIKVAAFARVYDHICDILHFIGNPAEDETEYHYKSRPYPTDSYLQESPIETSPIQNRNGDCFLGEGSVGPFENIGPISLDVIARGIEIKEWRYVRGFHMLSDIISELSSAEAHIRIQTDDGVKVANRLLPDAGAMIVRGDNFEFQAELLDQPRACKGRELCLGLDGATAKITLKRIRAISETSS